MNKIQEKNAIVLCGFMACGKSTLGKALAAQLGYAFADTDQMLFKETGLTIQEMFALGGEAYFRDREYETVQKAAQLTRTVISTGGGVMTFERNAQLLSRHAHIIHVRRSFDACYTSICERKNRPLAESKTREELLHLYESRTAAYEKYASFTLINDGTPQNALAALMLAAKAFGVR